jgi:hypothetical protein
MSRIDYLLQYHLKHSDVDRETGYYWIKFPGQDRWQPGGWDNRVKTWSLMGSQDPWFEQQLVEIGPRITEP